MADIIEPANSFLFLVWYLLGGVVLIIGDFLSIFKHISKYCKCTQYSTITRRQRALQMSVHGICNVYKITWDFFQAQISSPLPHAKDKMIRITVVGKIFFITEKPLVNIMMNFFQDNVLIEHVVNIWGLFKSWK